MQTHPPTPQPTSNATLDTLSNSTANIRLNTTQNSRPDVLPTSMPEVHDRHIVIVDDTPANLVLLKSLLEQDGYQQVSTVGNAIDAVDFIVKIQPSLVLLDLNMPYLSGHDILQHLGSLHDKRPSVLVLTGDSRVESKTRALELGAGDVILRPFVKEEVLIKVRNTLVHTALQEKAVADNSQLERLVAERTRQLELAQIEMLARLARVAEYRDDQPGEHIWRVARLSGQIAEVMGLSPDKAALLTRAARLHDIGKVAIPDGILFKPGRLAAAEFEIVKKHTTIGAGMLSGGQSELLKLAERIARGHHERWDGKGYPQGLAGEDIPLESRIVALADAFDAMTHDHAHRKALTVQEAFTVITEESGKQFDPEVVKAFFIVMAK